MSFDVEQFIGMLRTTNTRDKLFNPYNDREWDDLGIAPFIRRGNLEQLLNNHEKFDDILVGEAPGYRGCKRTGIPFTDDYTLRKAGRLYNTDFHQAVVMATTKERSAGFMWDILVRLKNPPLMWNIIPFHPHKENDQMSNRTPVTCDYNISRKVIKYFFENTEFKRYFAIGRQAEKKLKILGLNPIYIRHPSHGGSNEFKEGMYKHFEVKE